MVAGVSPGTPVHTFMNMGSLLRRLFVDDRGQDLVEYALLTAGLGLAGIAVWPAITAAVGVTYGNLDNRTQGLWRVPNPQ